jgi:signal transduction histidine kinase
VRDQGLGIPPADLPHIFKPFARGSNVTGHIGGTGMGLASAERIAVGHGGSLEVSSTLGQGSAFVLRLPLVCPPVGQARDGDADRRPPSPSASPPSSLPHQEGSTSATTPSR